MSRKIIITSIVLLVAAVVVLIALGIWLGSVFGGASATSPSQYSVVSLTTGELYFGKLSWFPAPHLANVWSLSAQRDQNGQAQLGLNQFQKTAFAPVDEIYLNPKQITWWSRLRNDSQIAKAMDNPALLQQQQQSQQQPSGTFKGPTANPPTSK